MSFIRRALAHVEGPMNQQHSPLPWQAQYNPVSNCVYILDAHGDLRRVKGEIAVLYPHNAQARADGYFICLAVNTHDALLAAAKVALAEYTDRCWTDPASHNSPAAALKAVIAKAEAR